MNHELELFFGYLKQRLTETNDARKGLLGAIEDTEMMVAYEANQHERDRITEMENSAGQD